MLLKRRPSSALRSVKHVHQTNSMHPRPQIPQGYRQRVRARQAKHDFTCPKKVALHHAILQPSQGSTSTKDPFEACCRKPLALALNCYRVAVRHPDPTASPRRIRAIRAHGAAEGLVERSLYLGCQGLKPLQTETKHFSPLCHTLTLSRLQSVTPSCSDALEPFLHFIVAASGKAQARNTAGSER